jgi:hypothetical protein
VRRLIMKSKEDVGRYGSAILTGFDEMFDRGRCPRPEALLEFPSWRVSMVTGPLPSLTALGHRKLFRASDDGGVEGCNSLDLVGRWGYFRVSEGRTPDLRQSLLLDYFAHPEQGLITSRMQDYLRTTPDFRVMVGRFYLLLWGKLRFCGYFLLEAVG